MPFPLPYDFASDDQQTILALLLSCPGLTRAFIYAYRQMTIAGEQEKAIVAWTARTGQPFAGLAIEVREPSFRVRDQEVPGPQLTEEIIIRIKEDRVQNQTGLSAYPAGHLVMSWLHQLQIDNLQQTTAAEFLVDDRGQALRPNYDDPGLLVLDATLTRLIPRNQIYRAVDAVLTDDDNGNVTLTSQDGSTIFYTIDGTAPVVPLNADGSLGNVPAEGFGSTTQIYNGPFVIPVSGTYVRWISWMPGFNTSNVRTLQITIGP